MILTKQFLNEQIQQNKLNVYSSRKSITESMDFRKDKTYDVFISYSYPNRQHAYSILQLLQKSGFSVFVDFADEAFSRDKEVNNQTVLELVEKMENCKSLLYLHSSSSKISKWCPWELGYFSGKKNFRCAYLPIVEHAGDNFKNQEYLEIYPYVEYAQPQNKSEWTFWICENEHKYISLKEWINGKLLQEH